MCFRSFSTHIKECRGLLEHRYLPHPLRGKNADWNFLALVSISDDGKTAERPQTDRRRSREGKTIFLPSPKIKADVFFAGIREADVTTLRQREARNPCSDVTLIP